MRSAAVVLTILLFLGAAHAAVETEAVTYIDEDTELKGYLAYDDAVDGERPGVLIVHEWWGLGAHVKDVARELAKLGYVAFALDMYGKGFLTEDPGEASAMAGKFREDAALMRSRAEAGLKQLQSNPHCDGNKVVATGYCFGGTTVLEMARGGADVDGVVSFHGGLSPVDPAETPVFDAKVLVLHGARDPHSDMDSVNALIEELTKAGADWQLNLYGQAEHSFTNPDADKHGMEGVSYNKEADEASWEALKLFLKSCFEE